MPVSGLAGFLDHLWDIVGSCQFQTTSYNLRIVVEMAKEPALRPFWSLGASEWTQRPFMGHGGRLPISNDVVRLTYCGENGPEASFRPFWKLLEA